MNEVIAQIQLENIVDRELVRRGLLAEDKVRQLITHAVVDPDVLMLVLPQDQVTALGLRLTKESNASSVTVSVGNRSASVTCVMNSGSTQPVLSSLPLTVLDLHLDRQQQILSPRADSPLFPLYRI